MTREMLELGYKEFQNATGATGGFDHEHLKSDLMRAYAGISSMHTSWTRQLTPEQLFAGLLAFYKVAWPLDDLNIDSEFYVGKNASQISDIMRDDEKFGKQ